MGGQGFSLNGGRWVRPCFRRIWLGKGIPGRSIWAKVWETWGGKAGVTAGAGDPPACLKGRAGGRTAGTNQCSQNTDGFACHTKEFASVLCQWELC